MILKEHTASNSNLIRKRNLKKNIFFCQKGCLTKRKYKRIRKHFIKNLVKTSKLCLEV